MTQSNRGGGRMKHAEELQDKFPKEDSICTKRRNVYTNMTSVCENRKPLYDYYLC